MKNWDTDAKVIWDGVGISQQGLLRDCKTSIFAEVACRCVLTRRPHGWRQCHRGQGRFCKAKMLMCPLTGWPPVPGPGHFWQKIVPTSVSCVVARCCVWRRQSLHSYNTALSSVYPGSLVKSDGGCKLEAGLLPSHWYNTLSTLFSGSFFVT